MKKRRGSEKEDSGARASRTGAWRETRGKVVFLVGDFAMHSWRRRRSFCSPHPVFERTVLLAAFVIATSLSCGRKTAVRPPDLIAPQTIQEISAVNKDAGIEISWKRPTRYVDGSHMLDLAAFRIERKRPCCGFRHIQTITVEDRQRFRRKKRFRHLDATVDLGEAYSYRIIAITLDGFESDAGEAVFIRRRPPESSPDAGTKPQT